MNFFDNVRSPKHGNEKQAMKKVSVILLLALLSVFLLAVSATATELDFGIMAPTSGSISYAGGMAPLVGTGIGVDNVVGLDTLLHNCLTLDLFGATLDFTTGPSDGPWSWGGGETASITIKGGVDLNQDGEINDGDLPTNTLLLSGTFGYTWVFHIPNISNISNTFHITGSGFTDYKNTELLDFYGLPSLLPDGSPMPYSGNFNISFSADFKGIGEAFNSSSVFSGDVVNTPIPDAATMFLLGSACLIGFSGLRRKHNK